MAGPTGGLRVNWTSTVRRSLDAYEALTPDCLTLNPKPYMSNLENTLKQLRLSGLLQTLDVRLQEAVANRLGHAEFLELICQDEINVRQQRLMERRPKAADFRGLKTLEDFDWSFNPTIHRKDIFDLATGNFIRQAKDVLFLGPPGVGKTHLAQAIGYEAIKMNFQVLYRSIFDLVRDFMKDEAFNQQDRTLRRYLTRNF
ncbi:MAG: transposase/IS protein [Pedosphaera sp.]|nr:transposase/IS protein [Pedosphaera sp.]